MVRSLTFSATKRTTHAPITFGQQAQGSQGHMLCRNNENRSIEIRGDGGLKLAKPAREPASSRPKPCVCPKNASQTLLFAAHSSCEMTAHDLYECTSWERSRNAFETFLVEVRADGTPSAVLAVRSDNRGQFFGGDFGKLCRKRGIKQEFTPADSPKFNGVAEQALPLINDPALATRIQAPVMYPGAPAYPSLWPEAVF